MLCDEKILLSEEQDRKQNFVSLTWVMGGETGLSSKIAVVLIGRGQWDVGLRRCIQPLGPCVVWRQDS